MKIAVALCTYNGEVYLKEQIDSILNQTLPVNEIVICDDQSTDNTIGILNNYIDKHPGLFKVFINEQNLRSVKNFEKAITLCSGDFIFLSDQDDIWTDNKVASYINYFNENQTIDVIASNGYCIDSKSKITPKYAIWDVPQFLKEKGVTVEYDKIISYVSNIATGASMAFRKKMIPEIVPFPVIKNIHHDEWIAIISSHANSFVLLDEKYFYYRIHENQQVGGVFFDKTEKEKLDLSVVFDVTNKNASFKSYKKRLKRLYVSYTRNKQLRDYNTTKKSIFENNLIQIEKLFFITQKNMKEKYPFATSLLNITDKILNKRQFKKII